MFAGKASRRKPYNVLDTLELGCDGAKGGSDDGLVEGDEEDSKAERDDDEGKLGS